MYIINQTLGNLSERDMTLFKSIFDYSEVRGSMSTWNGQTIESNYIRLYGFRYWDEIEVNKINEKVKHFNSVSESCEMKVTDYQDYEVEYDNDRSYPASFTFSMIKKEEI